MEQGEGMAQKCWEEMVIKCLEDIAIRVVDLDIG
jgi:hypothetical protein